MRPNLRVRNAADGADLLLYDEIGFFGVRAQDVVRALGEIGNRRITLRVNSAGGDLLEAVAIYNALRGHKAGVETQIDALAASAATLVALAGSTVRMAENALFMIHEPFALTVGTADDHRSTAELLDKVGTSTLIPAYMEATNRREPTIRGWMEAETWFTAEEALEAGFIDEVTDPSDVRASFDRERFRFKHLPAALAGEKSEPTIRDLERACRDAGLSRHQATAFVAEGKKALSHKQALQRDAEGAELKPVLDQLLATLRPTGVGPCPRT